MKSSAKYHYDWSQQNTFTLLVDGQMYFPAMLESIKQANSYVYLEMYLAESGQVLDQFMQTLIQAVQRQVHVYLLVDDFGVRGTHSSDLESMTRAGIQLLRYNPVKLGRMRRSLFRDHRKLLVVDNLVAYIGGAGLTDNFWHAHKDFSQWHDLMLKIEGTAVFDWCNTFRHTWHQSATNSIESPCLPALPKGTQSGRVIINSDPRHLEIKQSFLNHIRNSQKRLWMATAYFVPSWKLRRALCRAANRGADVRLLLPGPFTDHPAIRHAGRRFYHQLLRHGVKIFEYQPRFIHAKVLLSDNWVSLGSSNVDRWGQRWNLDGNQEIDDEVFATEVADFFLTDFQHSEQIQMTSWSARPWYRRFLEWFWGKVDIWLEKRR